MTRTDTVNRPHDGGVPYLQALAVRIDAMGWQGELVLSQSGRPHICVINPAAPVLNEEITAAPTVPGLWWFWWSWGERIACVENLDLAAARIAAVLRESAR
ncbi:hypothetical protein NE236_11050 [Actinoallomurus purpureus]|uniref:hypothetical protein n=1 Tax=Actinoallomurus purpureus TaxID=478114 RepID=UPI0020924CB2|nr:hypothetical protein [Actinoallomurus purpureus]MCO6005517.1 hypothetical protein [Actinoallomurus purpureus]